jgi:YHS domain-containing protein
MKNLFLLFPFLSVLLLARLDGRAEESKQRFCPLMVEDPAETDTFVEYKGVKVYLCCSSCKRQWNENPDYFAVVSAAQAPRLKAVARKDIEPLKQQFCPVYTDRRVHPKGPSLVHNGRTIYFCKQRALDRFKEDPGQFLKNLK